MLKSMINSLELNILYVRDLTSPLEHQKIDFYIQEGIDGTYEIYELPSYYWGYHSDFHNRFAYNFDNLSLEDQKLYQESYRHMLKNENGSYYENSKNYIKKKNE